MFLGIGAIMLFRHSGPLADGRAVLAAASILLALLAFRIGRVRKNRVASNLQTAVCTIGWATAGLAIAVIVFLL